MSPERKAKAGIERVPQIVTDQVLKIVFEAIDINEVLAQIDLNSLLKTVDLTALLDQVDLNEVLGKLDLNQVLGKVDLNALLANVDMEQLLAHTEFGAIIARSTSGVLTGVLDLVRSITVGLDDWLARLVNRLRRRRMPPPAGPAHPVTAVSEGAGGLSDIRESGRQAVMSEGRQGQYAGLVSRLSAFVLDVLAAWGAYALLTAAFGFFWQIVTGSSYHVTTHRLAAFIVAVAWGFFYFAGQWSLGGQTIGMAIFGVRVVRTDGTTASSRQAMVRTLVLPVAVVLAPISALMVLFGRARQGPHDDAAHTVVVYSWDARAARMRWLAAQPSHHVVHSTVAHLEHAEPSTGNGATATPAAPVPTVVVDAAPGGGPLTRGDADHAVRT